MNRTITRTGAYAQSTRAQVAGTLREFRHMRAFIRSQCDGIRPLFMPWPASEDVWTKQKCAQYLRDWVNTAINRKASVPPRGRKDSCEYQLDLYRDKQLLNSISHRIRVYQFNTPEVRQRFAHKLSRYDD